MSFGSTLILLGVLVILLPLSGLPISWSSWLLFILGAIIVGMGTSLRLKQHSSVNPSSAESISNESPSSVA